MVKPKGKGPLGRPRREWQDNIKMNVSNGDVSGLDLSSNSG